MTWPAGDRTHSGSTLQFGHSVAAVDDAGSAGIGVGTRTRFNSATASPPWMTAGHGIRKADPL